VLESEVLKAGQISGSLQNNITAVAAVTAVGSAVGNVFLGMEAERAVTAVAGLNINLGMIYKHLILPQNNSSLIAILRQTATLGFPLNTLNQATG
jgi:hypothetical protein